MDNEEEGEVEAEEGRSKRVKLGGSQQCLVCRRAAAKYRCPGCGVVTCSAACVKEHKRGGGGAGGREEVCDGKRRHTFDFVPREGLSQSTLESDLGFLESVARVVARGSTEGGGGRHGHGNGSGSGNGGVPRRKLSKAVKQLVSVAASRGVTLLLAAEGMADRVHNTSRYDAKRDVIEWRVEFTKEQAGVAPVRAVCPRVDETASIKEAVPPGIGSWSQLFLDDLQGEPLDVSAPLAVLLRGRTVREHVRIRVV